MFKVVFRHFLWEKAQDAASVRVSTSTNMKQADFKKKIESLDAFLQITEHIVFRWFEITAKNSMECNHKILKCAIPIVNTYGAILTRGTRLFSVA